MTVHRSVRTLALLAVASAWMATSVSAQKPSTANGEWPHYTADEKGTKYSPLDQIDASNFDDLEVALLTEMPQEAAFTPARRLAGAILFRGLIIAVVLTAVIYLLARQIARGAPADVFIAADAVWLNYLAEGGHYEAEPVEIARNRLVWVRTFSSEQIEEIRKTIEKFKNESGEKGIVSVQGDWGQASVFITGDPDYVPLGQYAKEALINMGMWESHQNRLIPAKNSRQAVFLIETQAPAEGVIYLTDALASENIMVFNEIPQDSHTPIVYWAVAVKQSNSGKTKKFLDFLKSEDFKTILQSKGFEVN